MDTAKPTNRPVYWAALAGGTVVHTGITHIGEVTVSATLISNVGQLLPAKAGSLSLALRR